MRITIVGGGNIGTQFMVHCAEKGHEVIAYTSKSGIFEKHLNIVDEHGKTTHEGSIQLASADPRKAFSAAELILVTYPATKMREAADAIYQFASVDAIIGVVPGNGGSECAFAKCIERGNVFFALERVPAIARVLQQGKTVRSVGYRNELHVAAIPKPYVEQCCRLIESIFDMPCRAIPNFLNLTMTPSNPILHTARLRTLFKDYKPGVVYRIVPLFYEEWDDASSELLLACDDEVQNICKALPEFQLEYVKPLRVHYESPTVEAMTRKISSIVAFKGLAAPVISVNGGFIPNLHSRYFTADFSYGLNIIQQIARFAGVATPSIDATVEWYEKIAIEHAQFRYSDYGISSAEQFEKFYSR